MKAVSARLLGIAGIALAFAAPSAARAQTSYEVAVGRSVAGSPALYADLYTHGFAAQLSVHRRLGPRLGAEVTAFTDRFHDLRPMPCDCIDVPCTCPPGVISMALTGLTVNGVVDLTPRGAPARVYLVGGAGAVSLLYDLGQHELRPDLSMGAGLTVPVRRPAQLLVEVRLHEMVDASRSLPRWRVPMTFGLRF
jgi:hypothetical protein